MEEILSRIRDYADTVHGGQTRKYGSDPFIVHPVRVMETCRQYTTDLPVLAAALLHDVLEDTPVTREELLGFLLTVMEKADAEQTVRLVEELTDVYIKEKHPAWNRRKRKAREAARIEKTSGASQTVKYADIIDNCTGLFKNDPDFAPTFLRECKALLQRIPLGDSRLYSRAVEAVDCCLREVEAHRKDRRKDIRNGKDAGKENASLG